MFEVIDSLPRRRGDNVQRSPPPNVVETEICWPLGTAAAGLPPALCQRRMKARTLDGVVPTSFAERGARLWRAGRERLDVDVRTGERVSAACSLPHDRRSAALARWPPTPSSWFTISHRPAPGTPPLPPDTRAAV